MAADLIDVRQRRASWLLLRQALLQGGNHVDNVAAGVSAAVLGALALGFVFDQLFDVLGVSVVIFGRDRILPPSPRSASGRD